MSGFVAELRGNAEAFVRRRKIDALCTDEDKVAPGTRPSEEIRAFVTTLPDLRFSDALSSRALGVPSDRALLTPPPHTHPTKAHLLDELAKEMRFMSPDQVDDCAEYLSKRCESKSIVV